MKQKIRNILAGVFESCRNEGLLAGDLPDFVVEAPRSREHGDLAVNIAMMLAKSQKKPPSPMAAAACLIESIIAPLPGVNTRISSN